MTVTLTVTVLPPAAAVMTPEALWSTAVNRPVPSMVPTASSAVQVTSPSSMATGRLYQAPAAVSATPAPGSRVREDRAEAEPSRRTVREERVSVTRTVREPPAVAMG